LNRALQVDDLAQLGQKPAIDPGQFVNLIERPVPLEGGVEIMDPVRVGDDQLASQRLLIDVADIGGTSPFK
jgi:hypothetical protein